MCVMGGCRGTNSRSCEVSKNHAYARRFLGKEECGIQKIRKIEKQGSHFPIKDRRKMEGIESFATNEPNDRKKNENLNPDPYTDKRIM